ncbi:MAG TPA: hypothetical protein DEQ20_00885 [Desulfobulbaceae bacterium]|nr:hypothetical protein [Desulfobulbaceae bacterium]
MNKIVLSLAVLLSCSGCATQKTVWFHDTKTEQDYYRDQARCWAMASSSSGQQQIMPAYPSAQPSSYDPMASFAKGWNMGSGMRAAADKNRLFKSCMFGEGYEEIKDGRIVPNSLD